MKKILLLPLLLSSSFASGFESVTMFPGQARVEKTTVIELKKGSQETVIPGLPAQLIDDSVRVSTEDKNKSTAPRIQSVTIELKALLEEKRKRIADLEVRLDSLYADDQILVDSLQSVHDELALLSSIGSDSSKSERENIRYGSFSEKSASAALAFHRKQQDALQNERRKLENQRKELNEKIQVLEHELMQAGGNRYYSKYTSFRKKINESNRNFVAQEQLSSYSYFSEKREILDSREGDFHEEKNLVLGIYAPLSGKATLVYSYLVPSTNWSMSYDLRADTEKKKLELTVYSSIQQESGEDWNDARIILSTARPASHLYDPTLPYWYLDVYRPTPSVVRSKNAGYSKSAAAQDNLQTEAVEEYQLQEGEEPQITSVGQSVEIELQGRLSLPSSPKEQKNLIRTIELPGTDFFYEIVPQSGLPANLKVKFTNQKEIPLLPGTAEFYVDEEFTARSNLSALQPGEEQTILLSAQEKIQGKKELVKKFEDEKGLFADQTRIRYRYRLEVKNLLGEKITLLVKDRIPVSRNKKISVEFKPLGTEPLSDKKTLAEAEYEQGLRKYSVSLNPGEKKYIDYDIIISFDKDSQVNGLR